MSRNLIVLLVVALALIAGVIVFGLAGLRFIEETPATQAEEKGKQISSDSVSVEEKKLIDGWIIENDLNQYGDLKDTVYIGGTPLFDESTAERTDKYEYIIDNHSDKPWFK